MSTLLDFEKPILELEGKVKELRSLADGSELDIAEEIARLEGRAAKLLSQTYAKLNAWQKTQVARHADRPHFQRLCGRPDRGFHAAGRRPALRRGPGHRRRPRPVPRPVGHGDRPGEGCRHRGPGAPQFRHGPARGLSQGGAADAAGRALPPAGAHLRRHARRPSRRSMPRSAARPRRSRARSRSACRSRCRSSPPSSARAAPAGPSRWRPPTAILMLEHSIYSVISPEGCAAILWRSADQAPVAAEALRLTAQDLLSSSWSTR